MIDVGSHLYGEVAGIQLVHSNIFRIHAGIKDPKTGIAITNISVLKLRLHPAPLSPFDEALCRTLNGTARTFSFLGQEKAKVNMTEFHFLCSHTRQQFLFLLMLHCYSLRGTAVAQWLRCCATNRKVAGSIPVVSVT
jgi:hypothetical protein